MNPPRTKKLSCLAGVSEAKPRREPAAEILRRRATKDLSIAAVLILMLISVAFSAPAQQTQNSPPPNAPSATPKLPDAPKPQANLPKPAPVQQPQEPAASSAPATTPSQNSTPEPPAIVQPYRPGAQPPSGSQNASDQLFTIIRTVNAVVVPVVVKDHDGNLVQDLDERDFSILENGVKQPITFFSNEPFPISAAVVLDADLSASAFDKVKKTLPALIGAFGQFDEISLWIYGNTFKKVHDFTGLQNGTELDATIQDLKSLEGVPPEPVVGAGPVNGPPTINGRSVDIRNQNINIYNNPQTIQAQQQQRPQSKVLNDAMLAAAQDLIKRPRQNHRILFVISDGHESGSRTSYTDVVKVLNSNQITVFGVDLTAAPILGRIQRLPIPKIGGANILAKYANATGGDTFNDFSVRSIEDAYNTLTQEARNQYTLAYTSKAGVLAYRDIDVRVDRPGCKLHPGDPNCVWVYAREGYFPLPPSRE
jgi:VWFA-related protein